MDLPEESAFLLCQRLNLGSTIHFINSSITDTIRFANDYGLYSFQFFLGGNMGYKRSRLSKKDIECALKLKDHFPVNIYSHMPYCYNLCGSAKTLAWNGDKEQDMKTHRCISAMCDELTTLGEIGDGCVVHIGSCGEKDKRKGIEAIAETINKVNLKLKGKKRTTLLLENCAGEGYKIGKNIEELQEIYELVTDKSNLGFCLDTCHLFGAGTYDLGKIDHVNKMLKDFDKMIGMEKLKLIHFNDSKQKYGSRKDSHESIGSGYIWDFNEKDRLKSLQHFIQSTKEIPTVLETWLSDYPIIQTI